MLFLKKKTGRRSSITDPCTSCKCADNLTRLHTLIGHCLLCCSQAVNPLHIVRVEDDPVNAQQMKAFTMSKEAIPGAVKTVRNVRPSVTAVSFYFYM